MDYLEEEGDMVLTENSGGRVRFDMDQPVRYIEMDGTISPVYLVKQVRSDRKGHITLQEQNGSRVVKAHNRRIHPCSVQGQAVVIESQDRLWALCPEDGEIVEVEHNQTDMTCPKCGKTFPLYWSGVKPMADTTTKPAKPEKAEKAPKPEKAAKTAPKPKAEKAPKPAKVVKEPTKVDLNAVAKHKHVELWTKKNVKFDHERIDVQAHTLLFTGENPRKLCFNTYNGTMGKKPTELPVEAFLANITPKGAKKDPWFPVPDLDKTRARLLNDGYEQHK